MGKYSAAAMDWYHWGVDWELSFAWWPHRCELTGEKIWLEYAYRGTKLITGPGDPVVMTRWHQRHEHLLWCIKGN